VFEGVLDPVLTPLGFEAVGTTIGTELQALSYAMRLALDWVGMADAMQEKSMHSLALFAMPKMNERQPVWASH
jgi:hypothetical protein